MIQSENKLELQEYREMFCKFRIKDMMNLKFELAIWKPQAPKPYEIVRCREKILFPNYFT